MLPTQQQRSIIWYGRPCKDTHMQDGKRLDARDVLYKQTHLSGAPVSL